MRKILFSLSLFCFLALPLTAMTWFDGKKPIVCAVASPHDVVVEMAVNVFCEDLQSVTGEMPRVVLGAKGSDKTATILLFQADRLRKADQKFLRSVGIPVDKLLTEPDAFAIKVADGRIYAVGSNGRGTAYALLELSRKAGVSPWVWWGDNVPEHRSELTIADDYYDYQSPAVERRGIFINDEDWSLLPWSHNNHDAAGHTFDCAVKGRKCKRIGVNTYKEIFKLLLRLRANMMWPAMHEQTVPFYQIDGAKEVADSFAIIIGTSHCEPLLRNNTTEWSLDDRGAFNYLTNSAQVQDYWIERLRETSASQNVYTIGMRGIHDGSMEGPKTLDEKTYWLQRVIDDQRDMLAKYVNKDVAAIPQAFVPYKEVLEIYENGLRVPDDVTLIWCDDNYGYLTRLPDAEQQKRSGGHGLYYHLSYWGRPHSYLWHTTTQPGLLHNELREAYQHNVRKQWVFNVHDPKCAAFDLEFCLDLAWHGVGDDTSADTFTQQWYEREFGAKGRNIGKRLAAISREYFHLASIRRPEFMGWNQVELDKKKVPGGKSPITDTEFSFSEFGNEADRYIMDYKALVAEYNSVLENVAPQKRDALFSALGYKVLTSAAFAERMLEGQRARMLASATDPDSVHQRNLSIARVPGCEKTISQLTHYYNTMNGGKWRGLMDDHPQNYPVYGPMPLPYTLSEDSIATLLQSETKQNSLPTGEGRGEAGAIAFNAKGFARCSFDAVPVQQLGHSMAALPIQRNAWAEYDFDAQEPMSEVIVAVIPTQAMDKGDLRFSVTIDGGEPTVFSLKEPYRSERWKLNVLRQQALRRIPVDLPKGRHTVRITALDDHIVLDQLMVDSKRSRQFYVIPR